MVANTILLHRNPTSGQRWGEGEDVSHFLTKCILYSKRVLGCVVMGQKLPYYLAYPMPLPYDDGKTDYRDWEYLKGMYPQQAKRILSDVQDECERMSYEGSMIYDEYPDLLQIRLMCRRICDKVKENVQMDKDTLEDLVQILLLQEISEKRKRRRAERKYFYL